MFERLKVIKISEVVFSGLKQKKTYFVKCTIFDNNKSGNCIYKYVTGSCVMTPELHVFVNNERWIITFAYPLVILIVVVVLIVSLGRKR